MVNWIVSSEVVTVFPSMVTVPSEAILISQVVFLLNSCPSGAFVSVSV